MARSCRPSSLLLVALWAAAASAQDTDVDAGAPDASEERYYAEVERGRTGDPAGAVRGLVAIADELPASRFADDALIEAARLSERDLHDPEGALLLYQRVLAEYPHSRVSRLAGIRAEFLEKNLVGGAEPLREFQAVLDGFAERARAESIARIEALLQKYPSFPAADRATQWLATQYAATGRESEALALYRVVIDKYPKSDQAPLAWYKIGIIHQGHHRWAQARAAFERMRDYGPDMQGAADAALEDLAKVQRWARLYLVALVILALFLAIHVGLIVVPRGRAAPPALMPIELVFYLPLAGLFALAALTENQAIKRATLLISLGGALVTWLTANALRCRPARRRWGLRAAAHAVAVLAAVAAIGYAAVYVQGVELQRLMSETLANGPERH